MPIRLFGIWQISVNSFRYHQQIIYQMRLADILNVRNMNTAAYSNYVCRSPPQKIVK